MKYYKQIVQVYDLKEDREYIKNNFVVRDTRRTRHCKKNHMTGVFCDESCYYGHNHTTDYIGKTLYCFNELVSGKVVIDAIGRIEVYSYNEFHRDRKSVV